MNGSPAPLRPTVPAYRSLKDELVGTWRFVATTAQASDGSRSELYGPNPNGIIMFTSDGHFALINTRPGRPKFVSNNSMQGTAEEHKTTVEGVIAYFGTYTVDENRRTYHIHIDGSSFPNYEETEQTRPFTITADELRFVNPAPTVGGSCVHAILTRAK